MTKKKAVKTKRQEQRDAILELFPDSVELMGKVLRDELFSKNGKKVSITGKQRLDVATLVVGLTVGRATPAQTGGPDTDLPPIRVIEVRKSYVTRGDAPTITDDQPIIAMSEPAEGASREQWLDGLQKEAVQASSVPEV